MSKKKNWFWPKPPYPLLLQRKNIKFILIAYFIYLFLTFFIGKINYFKLVWKNSTYKHNYYFSITLQKGIKVESDLLYDKLTKLLKAICYDHTLSLQRDKSEQGKFMTIFVPTNKLAQSHMRKKSYFEKSNFYYLKDVNIKNKYEKYLIKVLVFKFYLRRSCYISDTNFYYNYFKNTPIVNYNSLELKTKKNKYTLIAYFIYLFLNFFIGKSNYYQISIKKTYKGEKTFTFHITLQKQLQLKDWHLIDKLSKLLDSILKIHTLCRFKSIFITKRWKVDQIFHLDVSSKRFVNIINVNDNSNKKILCPLYKISLIPSYSIFEYNFFYNYFYLKMEHLLNNNKPAFFPKIINFFYVSPFFFIYVIKIHGLILTNVFKVNKIPINFWDLVTRKDKTQIYLTDIFWKDLALNKISKEVSIDNLNSKYKIDIPLDLTSPFWKNLESVKKQIPLNFNALKSGKSKIPVYPSHHFTEDFQLGKIPKKTAIYNLDSKYKISMFPLADLNSIKYKIPMDSINNLDSKYNIKIPIIPIDNWAVEDKIPINLWDLLLDKNKIPMVPTDIFWEHLVVGKIPKEVSIDTLAFKYKKYRIKIFSLNNFLEDLSGKILSIDNLDSKYKISINILDLVEDDKFLLNLSELLTGKDEMPIYLSDIFWEDLQSGKIPKNVSIDNLNSKYRRISDDRSDK